jgi:two-component system LytT family response regulator
MPKLKVLIADDEPLARERTLALLANQSGLEVVSECEDGTQAYAEMRRNPPDIAIIDIQMPGLSGLDLLRAIPESQRPAVIIATAHRDHAVDAFSEEVVDYLVKPFDQARIDLAIRRATDRVLARRKGDLASRVERALSSGPPARAERLAFRVDGRVLFIRPEDIAWVEAENNYCLIHLADSNKVLVRGTLGSLEQRLGVGSFARVSRSAVVNLGEVKELVPARFGDYMVLLRSGKQLPLSRGMQSHFREIMSRRP